MSSEQESVTKTAAETTAATEVEPQAKRAEEETAAEAAPKEETKEPAAAAPAEVVPVIGIDFGNKNLVAALGFDRERLPLIVPNNLGTLTTPFAFIFCSFPSIPSELTTIITTTRHKQDNRWIY